MHTRVCNDCLQEQSINQFQQGKAKPNGRRYRSHRCNTCRGKARREATAIQRAARPPKPQEKTCESCGETKPLSAYNHRNTCRPCWNRIRTAQAAHLRATDPAFQAWEAEKKRLWKLWAKEHPEYFRQKHEQWAKAHPEEMRAYKQKYKRTHKRPAATERDKLQMQKRHQERMATDPEYGPQRNATNRAWELANPLKVQERGARRRARQRGAPLVEKIDRAAIIARDRSICHICHLLVAPKDMSLDHLIPLAHGGTHTAKNLAVAHLICNKRRGAGRLPAQLRLLG
jgi:hypothetical protein